MLLRVITQVADARGAASADSTSAAGRVGSTTRMTAFRLKRNIFATVRLTSSALRIFPSGTAISISLINEMEFLRKGSYYAVDLLEVCDAGDGSDVKGTALAG